METASLALVLKFSLAALIVLGGFIALRYGYILYRSGVGLSPDGTNIETDRIKINLRNVGAGVMLTSVAWAGLGYWASPSFKTHNGDIEISSLSVPTITVPAPGGADAITDLTKEQLASSLKEGEKQIQFDGIFAHFLTIGNIEMVGDTYTVSSDWMIPSDSSGTDDKRVRLVFAPKLENSELVFQPSEVAIDRTSPKPDIQ